MSNQKAERIRLKCDNCGKDIYRYQCQVESASFYYCSRKCMYEHRKQLSQEKYTAKCDFCGKEYRTRQNVDTMGRYHFCSVECRTMGLRKENREVIDLRKYGHKREWR